MYICQRLVLKKSDKILNTLIQIYFIPLPAVAYILLAVSIISLFLLFCFSASETAFFSLTQEALEGMGKSKSKKDVRTIRLISSPHRLSSTISIGSYLSMITFIITTSLFLKIWLQLSPLLGGVVATAISLALLLIIGQFIPRLYATLNAQHIARKNTTFIYLTQRILHPFVLLLERQHKRVKNRTSTKEDKQQISMDELSQVLEIDGQTEMEEKTMLEGIIRFGNIQVSDIMTSRVDMIDVDIKTNFSTLLDTIIHCGYSRLPVYAESRDNIRGILFGKDLLPYLDKPTTFRWQSLIRPPYYVPETKKIDNLLNEFQENRIHLAIVVDEYGGTSGLVTLEDILEEIIGDINDEYDEVEILFEKIDNYTFIFNAKIALNDFFKAIEVDPTLFSETTDNVETLAGLMLEIKGEIPHEKELLQYKHFVFEVIEVDNRRIKKVKVHIKNQSQKNSNNEA